MMYFSLLFTLFILLVLVGKNQPVVAMVREKAKRKQRK